MALCTRPSSLSFSRWLKSASSATGSIDRWESFSGKRWQQAVSLGVAPLAVGLIFSGASLIARSAGLGWGGAALVVATVALSLRTRWHPLWFIGLGALLGGLGWV